MNIVVLGGGATGLTAAYYLTKKGHQVTLFEKEAILGGMSVGFKDKDWKWFLEKTYHHFFSSDQELINLMKEVGFKDYFFKSPETSSLYSKGLIDSVSISFPPVLENSCALSGPLKSRHLSNQSKDNYRIYPVDTPQDFLKFPLLSLFDKLRAGVMVTFLKLSPHLPIYEKQTAETFLRKTMGEKAWINLWQELFRKKFGKNAGNILASFIWARIKKRTKKLGYITGGFQSLINYLEKDLIKKGVIIKKKTPVNNIEQKNKQFVIYYGDNQKTNFDLVISTLPTPVLVKIGERLFPKIYLSRLQKIKYLHASTLILQTSKPLFEKTYWVNVNDSQLPFMALVQHTNYIDNTYYGGRHILYIGDYIDNKNKLLRMSTEEMVKYFLPYLKKINPDYGNDLKTPYSFKTYFAQPIFDKEFLKNKPDFITPIKNFYIANLDMTYPYDRGTNYAVVTAKKLVEKYF